MFNERAILVGRSPSLVGVLSGVDSQSQAMSSPLLLMLNAGLIGRVGPNRLYVKLARELAVHGVPSLRFDLSGLGDSPPRSDGMPSSTGHVLETRLAMDWLQTELGQTRFIVGGICSAAATALATAQLDSRVKGVFVANPDIDDRRKREWAQRVADRYYWRGALLDARCWLRLVGGRSNYRSILASVTRIVRRTRDGTDDHDESPLTISENCRTLAACGTKILVLSSRWEHDETLNSLLSVGMKGGFGDAIQAHVIPGTDHVFTPLKAQRDMLQRVVRWVTQTWPANSCGKAL